MPQGALSPRAVGGGADEERRHVGEHRRRAGEVQCRLHQLTGVLRLLGGDGSQRRLGAAPRARCSPTAHHCHLPSPETIIAFINQKTAVDMYSFYGSIVQFDRRRRQRVPSFTVSDDLINAAQKAAHGRRLSKEQLTAFLDGSCALQTRRRMRSGRLRPPLHSLSRSRCAVSLLQCSPQLDCPRDAEAPLDAASDREADPGGEQTAVEVVDGGEPRVKSDGESNEDATCRATSHATRPASCAGRGWSRCWPTRGSPSSSSTGPSSSSGLPWMPRCTCE